MQLKARPVLKFYITIFKGVGRRLFLSSQIDRNSKIYPEYGRN